MDRQGVSPSQLQGYPIHMVQMPTLTRTPESVIDEVQETTKSSASLQTLRFPGAGKEDNHEAYLADPRVLWFTKTQNTNSCP